MSKKHPLIVVTGSSGAGTSMVKKAFQHIFIREGLEPATIEGDSFHRFDRQDMHKEIKKADKAGQTLSHFGPKANLFKELEECFKAYSETGMTKRRHYAHNAQEAEEFGIEVGKFTAWEDIPVGTDLLFYEGLHGCVKTDEVDLAKFSDLKVGVNTEREPGMDTEDT